MYFIITQIINCFVSIPDKNFKMKFKTEILDRPNKAIVYPFALLFLFGFGYFNYRRDKKI